MTGMVGVCLHSNNIYDLCLTGFAKRIMNRISYEPALLSEFKSYVASRKHQYGTVNSVSFEKWLPTVNQPEYRRKDYRKAYGKYIANKYYYDMLAIRYATTPSRLWKHCKGQEHIDQRKFQKLMGIFLFKKREFYTEHKTSRAICPRGGYDHKDVYKTIVGPATAAMQDLCYSHKHFIKHVPVPERPKFIEENVYIPGWYCYSSDYTSFEGTIYKPLQDVCEMVFYEHMLSTQDPTIMTWIRCQNAFLHVEAKGFTCDSEMSPRMSGEMCTSLGNGITNWELFNFICHLQGAQCRGIVEGDDGLFMTDKPINIEPLTRLGMIIKLVREPQTNLASFCGNIYDLKTYTVISDPLVHSAAFGMSTAAVGCSQDTLEALTYSKALSLLYCFKGCPILRSLARRAIRTVAPTPERAKHLRLKVVHLLDKTNVFNWWTRQLIRNSLSTDEVANIPIHDRTRMVMMQKFGISVGMQKILESQLDDGVGWLDSRVYKQLIAQMHPSWISNWKETVESLTTPVRRFIRIPNMERAQVSDGIVPNFIRENENNVTLAGLGGVFIDKPG